MLRLRTLLDRVITARQRRRLNTSDDGLGIGFTLRNHLLVGTARLVEAALRVLTHEHTLIVLLLGDITLVHVFEFADLVTVALRRGALSGHLNRGRILYRAQVGRSHALRRRQQWDVTLRLDDGRLLLLAHLLLWLLNDRVRLRLLIAVLVGLDGGALHGLDCCVACEALHGQLMNLVLLTNRQILVWHRVTEVNLLASTRCIIQAHFSRERFGVLVRNESLLTQLLERLLVG